MVSVVQLVERQIVVLVVVGSSPTRMMYSLLRQKGTNSKD